MSALWFVLGAFVGGLTVTVLAVKARRALNAKYMAELLELHDTVRKLQSLYVTQEVELVKIRNEALAREAAVLKMLMDARSVKGNTQ